MFSKFCFNKKAVDFEVYEIIYEDAVSGELDNITSLESFFERFFQRCEERSKKGTWQYRL